MLTHLYWPKHALTLISAALLVSCSNSSSRGQQDLQPRAAAARAYLMHELKARLPSQNDTLDLQNADFRSIPSEVLTGVIYHWARYQLPRPTHAQIVVAIADLNGELVPLENSTDWDALARKAGWSHVQANPLRSCEELVQNAGPRRNPSLQPVLYVGPESPEGELTYGRDQIAAHVQPPQVSGSPRAHNQSVSAWFLESGRIAKYECRLAPFRTAFSVVSTVPNIGLMVRRKHIRLG